METIKLVLWLFTVFFAGIVLSMTVLGENLTVSVSKNVSISCNNETACVAFLEGVPYLFSGNGSSTLVPVFLNVTYDPEVTVIQNLTVVQNVTMVNVTTTNVTVTNCNATAPSVTVQANVSTELSQQLSTVCQEACKISEAERATLQQAKSEAEVKLGSMQATCESQINVTRVERDALNGTFTAQLTQERNNGQSWMFLALILFTILVVVGIVIVREARGRFIASGEKTSMPSPRKEVPRG